jgi:hypothetical protein
MFTVGMKLLIRNSETTFLVPEIHMKLAFIYDLYVSQIVQFTHRNAISDDLCAFVRSSFHLIEDNVTILITLRYRQRRAFRRHNDSVFCRVFLARGVLSVHAEISVSTFFHLSLYPESVPNFICIHLSCVQFFFILSGVRLSLLVLRPLLAYCTSPR